MTDWISGNIGYHAITPGIIYRSGNNDSYVPYVYVSYNDGQTWEKSSLSSGDDNCVYRIAFHPSDPDKWIVGGQGTVYITADNGHTWYTQNFQGDGLHEGFWFFTVYDEENADTIYMAGQNIDKKVVVMCSTDGGETWGFPQSIAGKESSVENVNDLKQHGSKLLLYTDSDVYEISKAYLISQPASVQKINNSISGEPYDIYDLSGRKQTLESVRGVFILNGQKVFIK